MILDRETKQMFELVLKKLDSMEKRFDSMETRQDEMYLLFRSLEENVKVTRAEQEKATYILADMQGKITESTEKVEDHEKVIEQIRAIN